ncbi:MAG: hypothetical protein H0U43_07715 [Chthoniobacterales bacterium]|nr:hypothetical protein [Chthoniobacterales bacterium]
MKDGAQVTVTLCRSNDRRHDLSQDLSRRWNEIFDMILLKPDEGQIHGLGRMFEGACLCIDK